MRGFESMRKLVINGGKPLTGEVTISGAKNSTVALIPAAILASEPVVLEGVPDIQDVAALIEILKDFNVHTTFEEGVLIQRICYPFQCQVEKFKV